MKIKIEEEGIYLLTLTAKEILMLDAGIGQIVCEDERNIPQIASFYELEWCRQLVDIGLLNDD